VASDRVRRATAERLGIQPRRRARPANHADEFPAGDAPRRIRAQNKRPRPSEIDRPDVRAKRAAFLKWVRRIDPNRLVFLDEAGVNIAMGRSHAWVPRGQEYVEARPMNWGNITETGPDRTASQTFTMPDDCIKPGNCSFKRTDGIVEFHGPPGDANHYYNLGPYEISVAKKIVDGLNRLQASLTEHGR
jgi:hypothetical protein